MRLCSYFVVGFCLVWSILPEGTTITHLSCHRQRAQPLLFLQRAVIEKPQYGNCTLPSPFIFEFIACPKGKKSIKSEFVYYSLPNEIKRICCYSFQTQHPLAFVGNYIHASKLLNMYLLWFQRTAAMAGSRANGQQLLPHTGNYKMGVEQSSFAVEDS